MRTPHVSPIAPIASTELQPSERARLRAISLCGEKTILRWWRGQPVRAATRERLERAARELGFNVPLQPRGEGR